MSRTQGADPLAQLIAEPLAPLPARWTVPDRVAQLERARAFDTPDGYWEWVARQQRWSQPWTRVRSGELEDFRYFEGGTINVADNCLDRWAEDPATADRRALIWEGEPGDARTLTYAELADESKRLAAGLLDLGVRRGDVVGIYMPNLVEAFTAIHACNRIGAVYTVLFSGFGPDAVASRLQAARASVVVVADSCYRRGKNVPLLETLRAARGRAPSVRATVVVDRTGNGVPLVEGEYAYADVLARGAGGTPCVPLDPNAPS